MASLNMIASTYYLFIFSLLLACLDRQARAYTEEEMALDLYIGSRSTHIADKFGGVDGVIRALAGVINGPRDALRPQRILNLAVLCVESNVSPASKALAKSTIANSLSSPDEMDRIFSIHALVRLKDGGAIDLILPKLDDAQENVRCAAATALAEIGTPETADKIEAVLRRRAVGLSSQQVAADYSFFYGYNASAKLRGRPSVPSGLIPADPAKRIPPSTGN
jgi:hypothetical protein